MTRPFTPSSAGPSVPYNRPLAPLPAADAPPLEMSKRLIRPRITGLIFSGFVLLLGIAFLDQLTSTRPNQLRPLVPILLVVAVMVLTVDLLQARNAITDVKLRVTALEGGDVTDEVRLVVTALHTGRSLVVSPAGFFAADRFALDAPGTGVLRIQLIEPGLVLATDIDVIANGSFGFFTAVRRVRVPLDVPMVVGPPSFDHLYPPAPVRPVFVGPSPGSPKGHELTRGVRPYLPGDHRRSVHWNATAHTGELMVREREGSGAVRIRVVVAVTRQGPAATVTAGRANAFIRDFVGQGCEIELITIEDSGRFLSPMTAPLSFPPLWRATPPFRTVTRLVMDQHDARRRLAAIAVGVPDFRESKVPTRVISDVGDQWL